MERKLDDPNDLPTDDITKKGKDEKIEFGHSISTSSNSASKDVLPILFILGSILMAVTRFTLMTTSRKYPWAAYKIVMMLLAIAGFGWLKRNHPDNENLIGYSFFAFSFLFITLFYNGGSDRGVIVGGGALLLAIFSIAAGIVFSFAKKTSIVTLLGSFMVAVGIIHILGLIGNAAGVELPPSYMLRMNILFWAGWILVFIGKKPTAKEFIKNMLFVAGISFFLFILIFAIVH